MWRFSGGYRIGGIYFGGVLLNFFARRLKAALARVLLFTPELNSGANPFPPALEVASGPTCIFLTFLEYGLSRHCWEPILAASFYNRYCC